jgi:hypothetical protein|tara:strand:+ start:324 stop:533 length:210 start_codon:yes stop_codon:yes gene_type:complete
MVEELLKIQSVKEFSKMIEAHVLQKRCNHIDAIVDHCEKTGLEFETAAKLVNKKIKDKLKIEAEGLKLL